MSTFVQDSISKPMSESYVGITTDSIRANINNKQIPVFDNENTLVQAEIDDKISKKELEAYNKSEAEEKEKKKQTWKNAGLAILGAATLVGGILLARRVGANSKSLEELMNIPKEDAGKFIRENWDISVEGSKVSIYSKNNLKLQRTVYCNSKFDAGRTERYHRRYKKNNEIVVRKEGNIVEVYTNDNVERVKDIHYKTSDEAKKAAEDLLNLNEPWVMYKEGEFTIIEAKDGAIVDLSKISRLIGRSHVIVRYRSPEEAKQAAKDLIMKEFDKPLEKQIECGITVEDKNVTGIIYGQQKATDMSHPVFSDSLKADYYHNHPYLNSVDYPLSGISGRGDLIALIKEKFRSVTAYNHLGEYNTAEIVDSAKATAVDEVCGYKLIRELETCDAISRLGKEKGERFVVVRHEWQKYWDNKIEPPAELDREYKALWYEYLDSNKMSEATYAKWVHKNYSEILPKYGVKYTTNYSNLINT